MEESKFCETCYWKANDAYTSREKEGDMTNFSIILCGDCIEQRNARIESFYGDRTYRYDGPLEHVHCPAVNGIDQRNTVLWMEVLEIENVSDLDKQWGGFVLGPYFRDMWRWRLYGPVSDTITTLAGVVGAAASIAGAVYTRRALRAQKAAAVSTIDPDLEQGPLPTASNASSIELPQVHRPEPAVLHTARLSEDSFHTAVTSVTTFPTTEGSSDDGTAAP
jgi:hypothetical protein